jgi:hypothetical protein
MTQNTSLEINSKLVEYLKVSHLISFDEVGKSLPANFPSITQLKSIGIDPIT